MQRNLEFNINQTPYEDFALDNFKAVLELVGCAWYQV